MTETPTTPEPTDLELVEIAKGVPLGGFVYRPVYDAGVAAGRTHALEEAARIAEAEAGEWGRRGVAHLVLRAIANAIRAAAIQTGDRS